MHSDSDLLKLFADHGDEAAFTLLVERHAGMVRAVIWRRTQDWSLVDEACWKVFAVLARKAKSLRSAPLAGWLNAHKPTLLLAGDRLINGDDRLYQPRTDLAPYDRAKLQPLIWTGVDISVESQGVERRPDSIQAYMAGHLRANHRLDILIDDDRAGEAADLVGLYVDGDQLVVILTHCKYSSGATPGHRVKDLYEVCGQVMRGARWRDHNAEPLLVHLMKRAKDRKNRGHDVFEVGDLGSLFKLQERARYLRPRFINVIAQPGLSIAESTDEQLRLLAGAESYVRAVTKGSFEVYGSH